MATTGLALEMYRRHFGTVPVATEVDGLVNVMAAWTDDRKALTVGVVNPTRRAAEIPLDVAGARLTGNGTRWVLTGPDPEAYNHPGRPPAVTVEESAVRGLDKTLAVPPCSVTIFRLEVM
jgi:alpha-N-arabinofuranosidase